MPRSSSPQPDPMIAGILTRALLSITQTIEPILAQTAWVTCAQCGMPTLAHVENLQRVPNTIPACGRCTCTGGIPCVETSPC
jgi:hypothetical protein